MIFYVYVIFGPDGWPVYIGKGSGSRWRRISRKHNSKLAALLIRFPALPVIKIREGLSEEEAFYTETVLIAAIGREPFGPLLNRTDGGEGVSGLKLSAETKAKIAAWNFGRKRSPEVGRAISRKLTGRSLSDEHRLNIGRGGKGRIHSAETKAKIGLANSNRRRDPISEETRLKLIVAATGRKFSPETREKISASKRGKKRAPFTLEHRAKTSASMKAYRARKAAIAFGNSEGF